MALLPTDNRLIIEQQIEDVIVYSKPRDYLGISIIGTECARKLWYSVHHVNINSYSARQDRLFGRGHLEEPRIQKDLQSIGVRCLVDPNNQPEVQCGFGHIKGHPDDILENIPDAPKTQHLGEYKTHNDRSFKDLLKNGLQKSKPEHYAQMIVYMYLLELKRGLYIAVNKNDDSRYYYRIKENIPYAKELIKRAEGILFMPEIPIKKYKNTWYKCKMCNFIGICHYNQPIRKTCLTCNQQVIQMRGKRHCKRYNMDLPLSRQLQACHNYELVHFVKNERAF